MPEGPTMLYMRERLKPYKGQKITEAHGYAEIPFKEIEGQKIKSFDSHGKEVFILLENDLIIRIHLMLFGSYLLNEKKPGKNPLMSLVLDKGEINVYNANVKMIDPPLSKYADPTTDILNSKWDEDAAFQKARKKEKEMISDVLFDQKIFAGVGNKIKDEVLWQEKVQPESLVGKIPDKKLKQIIGAITPFAKQYFKWKHEEGGEDEHLEVHYRENCPRDGKKLEYHKTGKNKRSAYFCTKCQKLYA